VENSAFIKEKASFLKNVYDLDLSSEIDLLAANHTSLIEKNGQSLKFSVVPRGLTHAIIQKTFKEKLGIDYIFPEELDNLEKFRHKRWSNQSYIIQHEGQNEVVDGDKELICLSAENTWKKKIATMTSLEVSQFALESFLFNGVPNDAKSETLCPGSIYSAGFIVRIFFKDGTVNAKWSHWTDAGELMRARSLKT
jgi:hypothetical protein